LIWIHLENQNKEELLSLMDVFVVIHDFSSPVNTDIACPPGMTLKVISCIVCTCRLLMDPMEFCKQLSAE